MGMAIYNAESRIKEVGIRKILGAKIFSIFTLLSQGFFLMIIIAVTLATPLAYFVNNLWLQEIPSRISIGVGILSIGIFILLGLGLLTIGSQSIRAAIINPVNTLRNE
jgi:putative ABC transport system permease protein